MSKPELKQQVIIGTAGHVDHGKTALIRALTGIETDRLEEEKERGISIELGFAPLRLPDGRIAGVIDVPGHEKFIPQMLSGVAGMDLVLLVVDANEGVMPQTREHLQIMELLELQRGILVLSKCDLVEEDWLDIVEEEIREQVAGTFMERAPCCRVSSITGAGLPELLKTISGEIERLKLKDSSGAVRLPVDRCFSISGFGTVVTGTLVSGTVQAGDRLELLPGETTARVRDLQVHGKAVEKALAGQRVALNLSGVSKQDVNHGSVVGTAGLFRETLQIDVRLRLLPGVKKALNFRDPVHFYLGTARAVGRVALLDRDKMEAGESALAQIHLDRPLMAHRGDRFIIRSYSPMTTIGGGVIIDAAPERHRRFRQDVLKRLEELESGEQGFLLQKIEELKAVKPKDLEKVTGNSRDQIVADLTALGEEGWVETLADQWVVSDMVRSWRQRLPEVVALYHQENPLQHGISRATLKSSFPRALAPKGFEVMLQQVAETGVVVLNGDLAAIPEWKPEPDEEQSRQLTMIAEAFRKAGLQVKNRNDVVERLGLSDEDCDPLFFYLVHEGELVQLNPESYLHKSSYEQVLSSLLKHFAGEETLTLPQFRDKIDSGRKLTQALLEYFDGCKYTRRVGDERVAWNLPGESSSK